jgi:tRNA(fMet)-specific endonuclease VapC
MQNCLRVLNATLRKAEVLSRLDGLKRQVPVLYPTTPSICRHYAEQFTRLKDLITSLWKQRRRYAK